jgi:hypothetical protein
MSAWGPESRADAALCAALLSTAPRWWGLVALLTLIWLPLVWTSALSWTGLLALGVWAWVTWLTMRCELDARVFQVLARDPGIWSTPCELDATLRRVLGVKRPDAAGETPEFDMALRIAGASRLHRALVGWALLQWGAVTVLWLWRLGVWGVS